MLEKPLKKIKTSINMQSGVQSLNNPESHLWNQAAIETNPLAKTEEKNRE
jgi:hypothetical protein